MRRPGILGQLRAQGLTVIEVNGWRDRGAETFRPQGSVNHDTVGAPSGYAPSLAYCVAHNLCNVLQSRERDRNGLDVVYLLAAGRANHAGKGGWLGLAGNTTVWGLEIEHVGTAAEVMPGGRVETAARVHAAFARESGFRAGMVCQHREWAPIRKQDVPGYLIDPSNFRNRVATLLAPSGPSLESDVFRNVVVTVPSPTDGKQLVGRDVADRPLGVFRHDVVATIKANDDGRPVLATVQVVKAWNSDDLILSFVGLGVDPRTGDPRPVAAGNVEVILGHPSR